MKWTIRKFTGGTTGKKIRHCTLRNKEGLVVACLFILPDGNLQADSWLCNEGWK